MRHLIRFLLPGLLIACSSAADVRLSGLFADHMVLQRKRPVKVWGSASPDEKITVSFAGQSLETTAGREGKWSVTLTPLELKTSPQELVVRGRNTVKISDVLVGDVWLCSGQSNMPFGLGGCDAPEDIRTADLPLVRFRGYWENFAGQPQDDLPAAPWHRLTPQTAPNCAAVPFYFARKVHQETKVPIGLLLSAVGGTEIECWMPPEAFSEYPANAPIAKRLDDAVKNYRASLPKALDELDQWSKAARAALAAGAPIPPAPRLPLHPNEDRNNWVRTQSLYNGMIHPLVQCTIRGVIWYQGENNGNEGDSYVDKQRALIETWRKRWGYEFPFYYVQLANWRAPNDDPSGGAHEWQYCRMAQFKCLSIPRTGMAVIIDTGDANDIHPKNKLDVGERLALWALAKDYGKDVVFTGPLFQEAKVEGEKMRISFRKESIGSGLMVGRKVERKPAVEDKNGKLARFAIAGEDRKWHWADAVIEGETVVVSSPKVSRPLAVRYGFSMNPQGANLYNRNGLPASPFRSDDW